MYRATAAQTKLLHWFSIFSFCLSACANLFWFKSPSADIHFFYGSHTKNMCLFLCLLLVSAFSHYSKMKAVSQLQGLVIALKYKQQGGSLNSWQTHTLHWFIRAPASYRTDPVLSKSTFFLSFNIFSYYDLTVHVWGKKAYWNKLKIGNNIHPVTHNICLI